MGKSAEDKKCAQTKFDGNGQLCSKLVSKISEQSCECNHRSRIDSVKRQQANASRLFWILMASLVVFLCGVSFLMGYVRGARASQIYGYGCFGDIFWWRSEDCLVAY